jgi:hypothetical protein
MSRPVSQRSPATAWAGWDEVLAGGPVRSLSLSRIRITDRGILIVEAHMARFGPDKANRIMTMRLKQISRQELQATSRDLRFYAHELREFVRYRRAGWPAGVPVDSEAAMSLWRQAHCGALGDYGLPLHCEDLLYHSDSLPFIGEVP